MRQGVALNSFRVQSDSTQRTTALYRQDGIEVMLYRWVSSDITVKDKTTPCK